MTSINRDSIWDAAQESHCWHTANVGPQQQSAQNNACCVHNICTRAVLINRQHLSSLLIASTH